MTATCPVCGLARDDADDPCARCLLRAALGAKSAEALPRRFGGYELVAELGRGGMGVVYRARDVDGDRDVALKLLKSAAADERELARFRDEAQKAARLKHEGIVRVLDVGEVDGRAYYAMELVEGASLDKKLGAYARRPEAAAALMAQVARAIHHAHQNFVLHRDIKPANILVDESGAPHVVDFGVARRLDADKTRTGDVVGTVHYMAPEQIDAPTEVNVAADVYALGAVLYELLCGAPPFDGPSVAAIVADVREREPRRPSAVRQQQQEEEQQPAEAAAAIDRDLETIVMKCLRKRPEDRYASAAGVAADLERWLNDEPIAARPPSRRERVARFVRRHLAVTTVATAAALVLLSLLVAAVAVARAQEEELRADVAAADAAAARALSGAVLFELRGLADELARAARDADVVAVARGNGCAPQAKPDLSAIARLRARAGGVLGSFASLLVLGGDGRWVARVPDDAPELTCSSFAWRDYFRGVGAACAAGRDAVCVSRAYVSRATNTVRFSLTAPIFDSADDADDAGGRRCVGVIEGAVESDRALGSFKLSDGRLRDRTAVLLARADRADAGAPLPSDWYVVLHDDVAAGSAHRQPAGEALRALAARDDALAAGSPQLVWTTDAPLADDDYRDAVAGGRWLAGIAPVGNTHFAVVVETRERRALAPNATLTRRLGQATAAALAGSLVVALAIAVLTRARRRR